MQPRQLTFSDVQSLINPSESKVYPAIHDHDPFFLKLKDEPEELLREMVGEARKIMQAYEHEHPIHRNEVVRKCLIEFATTMESINHKAAAPEEKEAITEYYQVTCISLFSCFKTMLNICVNDEDEDEIENDLRETINSFFNFLSVSKDYFAEEVINSYHKPVNESDLNSKEKANYEQACNRFEQALLTYKLGNAKEPQDLFLKISELKDLKDNGIALHFCSLVLNTAAQRLEEPTNEDYHTRLIRLNVAIEGEKPSTAMKYLPTVLKIIGAVVALVGLALLLTPPSLIATLGVVAQTPTASTALSIAIGGAATLFMGTRLPSPSRYQDAANTIFNANVAITQIESIRQF